MKKIIILLIFILTNIVINGQIGRKNTSSVSYEIQNGYMASGSSEQIITLTNLKQYNIITTTDTTDAIPDTIYVYVADPYFGDYVQVGVKNMLDWIDYEYILTSTIADTPVRYLILNPFAWKIKLVKNTGGVIKWVYEGR